MRRTLAVLILAATAVTVPAAAAFAEPPSRVTIEDTAEVLDDRAVADQIRGMDFHQPTHVAILTQPVGAGTGFDLRVRDYARQAQPEWFAEDGRWADGLLLIAFDTAGNIGVHTGPDRAISKDNLGIIEDSALGLRAAGQWNKAAMRTVEAAAVHAGKPWYLHEPFLIPMVALGIMVAGYAGFSVFFARKARRSIAAGDSLLAQVDSRMEKTAGHVAGIPEGSGFGARILAEYRDFMRRRDLAAVLGREVRGYTFMQLCREKNRLAVREYDVLTRDLDGVSATVADADVLLNMKPGWERAWSRELQYVKDDLSGLEAAVAGLSFTETGKALVEWKVRVEPRLSSWVRRMTAPRPQVEAILNEMWKARAELSGLLAAHGETVIQAASHHTGEQQIVRESMSVAARMQPRGFGIVERTYLGGDLVTAAEFTARVHNGRNALQTRRNLAAQRRRRRQR